MKKMTYLVMLPTALALLVTFQNCAQGFISQRNMLTTELEPSPPNNINGLMSKNCNQLIASSFHDSPILSSSLNNSDPALKISQLNIEYKAGDGVHNLLDIYHPRDISIKRPILVYIRGGDDGKQGVIANYPNFINYFIQKGFVFASINYRSYMQDKNLKVQDQATDIASGVKWLSSHASDFGGKSDDFVFLGFSTGAYLASLLNADTSYLSKVGLSTEILKGSISMDVPHYNEALNLELIQDTYLKPRTPMLLDLFGNTLAQQLASSPVNYINSGRLLKPMLLFTTGEKDGQTQDVSFLATSVFKSELDNANQLAEYYPLKN